MNSVNYKAHGVLFLVLAVGAWLLGAAVAMSYSALWGSINLALIVAAFLAMTVFPLYWLIRSVPALLVYGGLLAVAVVELRVKVCGDCKNVFCVLKKHPPENR